jgi:hypothetical protein
MRDPNELSAARNLFVISGRIRRCCKVSDPDQAVGVSLAQIQPAAAESSLSFSNLMADGTSFVIHENKPTCKGATGRRQR